MTNKMDVTVPSSSVEVRAKLVDALRLDLVGPWAGHAFANERLPGWVYPSNWYLTGFFPSSMGLSFLVSDAARSVDVSLQWGDYQKAEIQGEDGKPLPVWQRSPREATVAVPLLGDGCPVVLPVPESGGLKLHAVERLVVAKELADRLPAGTRSVSVFLVNHRKPDEERPDHAYAFQPELRVRCAEPFVPRPDLRGSLAAEWDEQVADLHYADAPEYATGHGVSVDWEIADGACQLIRTTWIPAAEVEKTATVAVEGVELSMEALGMLADGVAAEAALRPLVERYRAWISTRRAGIATLPAKRRETAEELLRDASIAADRIERGIS